MKMVVSAWSSSGEITLATSEMINTHKWTTSVIITLLFLAQAQCQLFLNPLRTTGVTLDSAAIYEGLLSPENNFIVIVQNFYVWLISSIGLWALTPFYQVFS